MKHVDGISVAIRQPNGPCYTEYANPAEKRHKDFVGSLGSRLVCAPAGDNLEVVVSIDEDFKLWRASGIVVIIVIGGASLQLTQDDNSQVYWLDRQQMNIRKDHVFTGFTTWKTEIQWNLLGRHPRYAAASADWLHTSDMYEANPGCVSVWVMLGKFSEKDFAASKEATSVTDPPKQCRYLNYTRPKIVSGSWFNGLESFNGREIVFEFINMASDIIDREQAEADPVFGHDDRKLYELQEDDVELEPETPSVCGSPAWGDEDYLNSTDFEAHLATWSQDPFQRCRPIGKLYSRRHKKRRMNDVEGRRLTRSSIANTSHIEGCTSSQKVTTLNDEDDQDDEEALPTRREPEINQEVTSQREPSRTQEPTPPAELRNERMSRNAIGSSADPALRTIDLTQDEDIDTRIKPDPTVDSDGAVVPSDADFEYRLRVAEIERDYQLERARIEADSRAVKRK